MQITIQETGPDRYAERKREWRQNNPDRHVATRHTSRDYSRKIRGFVCVDGEGMTTRCEISECMCSLYHPSDGESSACTKCDHAQDVHYHAYVLLGVGNQHIDTQKLGINELSWEECFEFLYRQFERPVNKYKIFCGFFLGYDFTHIFKSIPSDKAWKLYNPYGNLHSEEERKGDNDIRKVSDRKPTMSSRQRKEGGKPYPIMITGKRGTWEFDTLDERQLRLRPVTCQCADVAYHQKHCSHQGYCRADHHLRREHCQWENAEVRSSEWMYVNDVGSFFQKSFLSVINPEDWHVKACQDCKGMPCIEHGIQDCGQCKPVACMNHAIVTREEYISIKKGKDRRSQAVLDDEMRDYNRRENLILARVMEKFREGLDHFGIYLSIDKWYGPGQAAGKWIAAQGQKATCAQRNEKGLVSQASNPFSRKELIAEDRTSVIVERAARASYIAGWFEIFAHGHVPRITYEYDINSAYPDVIRTLPCMAHGKWEIGYSGNAKLRTLPKNAAFRLIHATVRGSDPHIGAMLHRDADNNICRPHVTHSWYWQDELEAALNAGLIDSIDVSCDEEACRNEYKYGRALTLTYFPHKNCALLCSAMEEMYQERLRVGKNTPLGKAAKLVYNSVYGKFAQLIGSPQWASNIYASRITSGCRKKILESIATHPEGTKAVVMIATDGIYFTSEHPDLDISKDKLGCWDVEEKRNLTLFKPGVYWDDDTREKISQGKTPSFKSRGVSARKFAKEINRIDSMFDRWNGKFPDDEKSWPSVEFDAGFSMVSCKQALIRGKWETAGKVSTSGRLTQNSFPDGKRSFTAVHDTSGEITKATLRITGEYDPEYRLYRSRPLDVGYIVSKPRDENQTIAHMKNEGDLLDKYTYEGTVSDEFARTLGVRD